MPKNCSALHAKNAIKVYPKTAEESVVKISNFQAPYGLTRVTSARQGNGGAAQNTYERMGGEQKDSQQGQAEEESPPQGQTEVLAAVTDEQVAQAIEAYALDTQTLESGLSVYAEGMGPGLLVHLKDAQGHVLRKLTGPEFVKLRENTDSKGTIKMPGKFLDQKI